MDIEMLHIIYIYIYKHIEKYKIRLIVMTLGKKISRKIIDLILLRNRKMSFETINAFITDSV